MEQTFHTALAEARFKLNNGIYVSRTLVARLVVEGEDIAALSNSIKTQDKI